MFYVDFFESVDLVFYIIFAFLFLCFSFVVGMRYVIGPTLFSAINFLSAASLGLVYAVGFDFYILVVSVLIFFINYYCFCGSQKHVIKNAYVNSGIDNDRQLSIKFFIVLFVLVNCIIVFMFGESGRVNKLTWTVTAGGLPYIYEALLMVMYCCFLHCLERRWFLLNCIILFIVGLTGYIFSSKGILINVFLIYAIYITRENVSIKRLVTLFFTSIIFIFILTNVYFGSGYLGLLALCSRAIATLDGTFSIFFDGMYGVHTLDKSVLYYYFDFFVSRIYGVNEGLGAIIAGFSRFNYPEFGGPNDSVVNYLLLSDGMDKVVVIITVFILSFSGVLLDRYVRTCNAKYLPLRNKIIVYPFVLLLPSLYQAVGTGLLILARIYVIIVPIFICWSFLRVFYGKKQNNIFCSCKR